MSGIELGVDLGTSNTVAVVRMPDGRSRTLLFDGSPLLPSAVYAEPSGAIVVGRDAVHSARLEPARFEPNPKRRIDDTAVLLGDREVPVMQLLSAVLARVVDELRRTMGSAVPQVTITCPAAWGATRRLVLSDAAVAAGLGQPRLVPEPVAAATYFTRVLGRQVPVGSVVVVHDFGAGTFDASVVARTAAGFEVLAVDGRDDIGGLDVDQAIIGHVRKICEQRDAEAWRRLESPSTVDDRRARRLLWDDVRVAKERLSRQPNADLTVPLLNVDIHLTREELEGLALATVEQTVRVTQGVMRWAHVPEGRVAGVFLVGGSSRMPLVATLLHRALGEPPVVIDSPELVVAEGSLLAGAAAQQPPAAGPAPGPGTGVMPRVLFDREGHFQQVRPVSGGPAQSGSGAPVQPVSPHGAGFGSPVSAPPVAPVPAGSPVQGPPATPPGGPAMPGHPQGQPPGPGQPPGTGQPQTPGQPYGQARPQGSGRATPPGPPVAHGPQGAQPVSAPPRPASGGAVYTTGRVGVPDPQRPGTVRPSQPVAATRPIPRDDAPPAYRAAPEPAYREPAYTAPAYEPARTARRSGGGTRAVRVVLVTIMLILVPLIAAYIAYGLTVGEFWTP